MASQSKQLAPTRELIDAMEALLLLLSTLILVQAVLVLVGLGHYQMLSRQLPSAIAATLLLAGMILAMMLSSWEIMVLSFVMYQSWTMVEGLMLRGRVQPSALALAPVNIITITGSLTAFFSGIWVVFAFVYLFHWSFTLLVGRKMMDHS